MSRVSETWVDSLERPQVYNSMGVSSGTTMTGHSRTLVSVAISHRMWPLFIGNVRRWGLRVGGDVMWVRHRVVWVRLNDDTRWRISVNRYLYEVRGVGLVTTCEGNPGWTSARGDNPWVSEFDDLVNKGTMVSVPDEVGDSWSPEVLWLRECFRLYREVGSPWNLYLEIGGPWSPKDVWSREHRDHGVDSVVR